MSTQTAREFGDNLSRLLDGPPKVKFSDLAKRVLICLVTSVGEMVDTPSDQTLSNWARGHMEPEKANIDWCLAIAEVLDVDLAKLHPVLARRGKLQQKALARRLYHKTAA